MQAMASHGVVGRGVLLDYYSWSQNQGKPYDPLTTHRISVQSLKDVAKSENVKFEIGDILLVRSGYTARYHELEKQNPQKLVDAGCEIPTLAGLEQTEEMKTFLHDTYVPI